VRIKLKILLSAVLILAFWLRFWHLDQNPPALNWDEVSHGYNAYSLLETGKDEWGMSWPLIFRAYGDYKLPVYIYLTTLSIAVFGLNSLAVRLPSALAGLLSVLATYWLVKELFKKETPAFLAAIFLAISPWHIFLSRPAFEAALASFLVISGVFCFLKGLTRRYFLPISLVFFGFSVHTYNSARVFTPLILITLLIIYRKEISVWLKKRKKEAIISLLLGLLFFVPWLVSFISPQGQARFRWVTILDQGVINQINDARTSSSLPGLLARLIHNKLTYAGLIFSRNYFSNFSPAYLFGRGGSHYQYNLPGQGVIYPIQAVLIAIGLFWLVKNWSKKSGRLVCFWWLLAVIPAAATRDNPQVLRTILVLPVPQILAALGVSRVWNWLKKRAGLVKLVFPIGYGLILSLSLFNFLANYFGNYRIDYSWSWQYGYQELAEYLEFNSGRYDQILITKKYGEPHEFLLFYLKWPPEEYRADPNLSRYYQSDWYWVDSFSKFVFINDWEIKEKANPEILEPKAYLLVTSPGNYPSGWVKLKTIDFLNNQPAFEILTK
jgi:4-amino-4-deoxy-L-arabinose transferase-like glycosyltransferase